MLKSIFALLFLFSTTVFGYASDPADAGDLLIDEAGKVKELLFTAQTGSVFKVLKGTESVLIYAIDLGTSPKADLEELLSEISGEGSGLVVILADVAKFYDDGLTIQISKDLIISGEEEGVFVDGRGVGLILNGEEEGVFVDGRGVGLILNGEEEGVFVDATDVLKTIGGTVPL